MAISVLRAPPQPSQPGAPATASPSNTAATVRGKVPSSRRSGSPQCGQTDSLTRAWQPQEGQAMSAGGIAAVYHDMMQLLVRRDGVTPGSQAPNRSAPS